jgi:hypothetical protein
MPSFQNRLAQNDGNVRTLPAACPYHRWKTQRAQHQESPSSSANNVAMFKLRMAVDLVYKPRCCLGGVRIGQRAKL